MLGHGRLYVVEFHAISITLQQDLFYMKPAADKICIVEQIKLGVVGGNVDAGDAQEELLDVEMIRVPATVTASSGGNSMTPNPYMANDSAAGFTARVNDTTKATTSGTLLNLDSDAWNSRIPYLYQPTPEDRFIVANAQAFVVRLNTTPADALSVNGSMLVRELP
jgi:hypothetical protein